MNTDLEGHQESRVLGVNPQLNSLRPKGTFKSF